MFREINISERGVMKKIKRMMAIAIAIPIIISTMIACGNGSDVLRSFPHDTAASDECADQLSVRQGRRYDRDRPRVEGTGF